MIKWAQGFFMIKRFFFVFKWPIEQLQGIIFGKEISEVRNVFRTLANVSIRAFLKKP